MSLTQKLLGTIQSDFSDFTKKVSEKYNLNFEDLSKLWDELGTNVKLDASSKAAAPGGGCVVLKQRGPGKNTPCGGKISAQSTTKQYCLRHLKHESGGTETKTPATAKPADSKAEKKKCIHTLTRGTNKGNQCGNPVTNTSEFYCSRHNKAGGAAPVSAPPPTTKPVEPTTKKEEPSESKEEDEEDIEEVEEDDEHDD